MSNQASFINSGLMVLQTNCALQQLTPDCALNNQTGGIVHIAGGNSSFSCPFTNFGTLDSEFGTLTLNNNYTLNASSVNHFTVGGPSTVLAVPALNPAGVLSVSLTNGYTVTNGTTITLMNYGSDNGAFAVTQLPALSPSLQWKLYYGPTSLALEAMTAPVQLSAPAMLANGSFQFMFSGPPANGYWIQASTNLVDWLTLETNSPFTGQVDFTDSAATNFSQRFYRGILVN